MLIDHRNRRLIITRCFAAPVNSVVVVLAVKTYVYNFADLTLIDCLDTCNNPNGLCALNSENSCMPAIPHTEKGHVKVRSFAEPNRTEAVIMCH